MARVLRFGRSEDGGTTWKKAVEGFSEE